MSLGSHPRVLSRPITLAGPLCPSIAFYVPRTPFGTLRIAISTRDAYERTRHGRLLRPLPCGRSPAGTSIP
ncbi:uncharacterized protein SCHCODRAFT_02608138 [Schizophyllum commune H4-8]|uniref:uncharacterized protein n=1 Tax=Schizophyllum commune (strain H4-8 / FGSC 9210) TaxID=578458 RepID=UPI00215F0E04|nr:uncharacterized protein SCHCODRAFT_02608138 [Schizophyllum commune H4-8]KAI5900531.1 hypothetical protein SCHCODRAFT_02608138 [Schizophyllum commune H4-8]